MFQKDWRWFGAEFMKGYRAELEEDRSINRQKISSLWAELLNFSPLPAYGTSSSHLHYLP
jgi:hypothetical protein